MGGWGKDTVVRKDVTALNLREIAAKTTLQQLHQQGHPYVELRRDGKRIIFFCTICLTPCYSDNSLFDHLSGSLHTRRHAAAEATLFGSLPWPFNDGVLFFGNSHDNDLTIVNTGLSMHEAVNQPVALVGEGEVTSKFRDGSSSVEHNDGAIATAADLAIVCVNDSGKQSNQTGDRGTMLNVDEAPSWTPISSSNLVIPGVLHKAVVGDLGVRLLGYGKIAYRIIEDSKGHEAVTKIWCAWAGKDVMDMSEGWTNSSKCDFAVVNFPYACFLGRKWNSEGDDSPVSPESFFLIDEAGNRGKRKKKYFSDQEVSSEESSGRVSNSHKEDGQVTSRSNDTSGELQICISNKSARRELRKQKRFAAERACDICGHPMLPGKDVAALLNCRTGYLACSSRNISGAFHIFHTSCLIHWILMCEYEMLVEQLCKKSRGTRGRKGRKAAKNLILSILCPECQGTGAAVEGEEFEKPRVPLSEMFCYRLKAIEAHKAWMKNPEILEECSTGLFFPSESTEISEMQGKVLPLKLADFYRAED